MANKFWKVGGCHVEELALPTRAIQLLDKVLSTDEAASAELRKAEAAHQTRSSSCLFKAATTTPCICRELPCLRQKCNKHLKRTLESYSTAAVQLSRGCSLPQCRTQWRLWGRVLPGPEPHTTFGLCMQTNCDISHAWLRPWISLHAWMWTVDFCREDVAVPPKQTCLFRFPMLGQPCICGGGQATYRLTYAGKCEWQLAFLKLSSCVIPEAEPRTGRFGNIHALHALQGLTQADWNFFSRTACMELLAQTGSCLETQLREQNASRI